MSEQTVGISRVIELENILGEILDSYEMGTFDIVALESTAQGDIDTLDELFDRASIILARDDEPEED